jgi:hypothetical protein
MGFFVGVDGFTPIADSAPSQNPPPARNGLVLACASAHGLRRSAEAAAGTQGLKPRLHVGAEVAAQLDFGGEVHCRSRIGEEDDGEETFRLVNIGLSAFDLVMQLRRVIERRPEFFKPWPNFEADSVKHLFILRMRPEFISTPLSSG